MNELRKQFEALPNIRVWFVNSTLLFNGLEYEFFDKTLSSNNYTLGFINGAWYEFQEQQKKIDSFKKMTVSLRNEFNLWADDTESFNAIEAQIENLEELLK